jgi:predicted site-specific integrase-resolvase
VTAYRWFREGTLPVPARRMGRLILVEPPPEPAGSGRVVAYCRVSSADRRVVVLEEAETSHDLVRDVTEVLTSLCARLYGRRSAARAAKAVATGDHA